MLKILYSILFIVFISVTVASGASYWTFKKDFTIPLPGDLAYITADSSGNLYYTTFEDNGTAYANRVSNPLDDATRAFASFAQDTFPSGRGFLGIALDSVEKIYISCDDGSGSTSYIKRFLAGGSAIDTTFLGVGVSTPGYRTVGIAIETWTSDNDGLGPRMFTADLANAKVKARHMTGEFCGTTPWANMYTGAYPRDVDIDNATHNLYVMKNGNVLRFTPDSTQNLDGYVLSTLVDNGNESASQFRAAQGICFDKYHNQIIYALNPDSTLRVIDTAGAQQQILYGHLTADSGAIKIGLLTDGAVARINGVDYLYVADNNYRIAIYKWGPIIEWSGSLLGLHADDTIQFTARGGSGTYTWSCSNYAVGTVTNNGLFTAIAPGSCTVTVTDPSSGSDTSDTITVTATDAPLVTDRVESVIPRSLPLGELFE
jgi:hypothetical protein